MADRPQEACEFFSLVRENVYYCHAFLSALIIFVDSNLYIGQSLICQQVGNPDPIEPASRLCNPNCTFTKYSSTQERLTKSKTGN